MGSQQQFCLRWNNHQGNMVNVFDSLLNDNLLVDVTLACDGQSLQAHKLILSACSPFFQEILVKNPCKHPVIILKDMTFHDIKAILQFMYKGEVNVSQDQLSALLKTAEALKVKGLAEVTSEQHEVDKSSILQEALSCNNYQHPNAKLIPAGSYIHIPTLNTAHMPIIANHVPANEIVTSPPRKRRRKKVESPQVVANKAPKKMRDQPLSPEPVDVDVCCEDSESNNGPMISMSQSLNESYQASFQTGVDDSTLDDRQQLQPQILAVKQAPLSPPMDVSSPQPQEETVLPIEFMEQSLVTADIDEESNSNESGRKKKDKTTVNNCDEAEEDNENGDLLDNHFQDQDSSIIYSADQSSSMLSPGTFNDSSGGGNVSDGMIKVDVDAGPSGSPSKSSDKTTISSGMNLQYEQYKKMWDTFSNTCPLCEKKMFVENRKRHFFTVHSNFRFKCSLCPATYTRKDNLRFHQRIKHPEQLM